jgi:hypothetical protein
MKSLEFFEILNSKLCSGFPYLQKKKKKKKDWMHCPKQDTILLLQYPLPFSDPHQVVADD